MNAAEWRSQSRTAVRVLAVVTLLGAPAGLVWAALAPRLDLVVSAGTLTLLHSESEALIADDGYFLFITAGLGVLTGLAVYLVTRRRHGPGAVLGLAAGGLTASAVAAQVGERLYRGSFEAAARTATHAGDHVRLFVAVRADGVLLGWSFAAVAVYLLAVLLFQPFQPPVVAPEGGPAAAAPHPLVDSNR